MNTRFAVLVKYLHVIPAKAGIYTNNYFVWIPCQARNDKCAKLVMKKNLGFTLIELMVVISILAILAVGFFVNFKSFGEDAALKNSASDIQSALRLAQSNATAGVKCGNSGGATWSILLNDRSTVILGCLPPGSSDSPTPIRRWSIPLPIYISEIKGIRPKPCDSSFTPSGIIASTITINFFYSGGKATFADGDSTNECLGKSTGLVIKLNNNNSAASKKVILDKGGSVDVQ